MLQCMARAHGVWASPARLEWYSEGLPAPPASPVFLSKLARVDLGDFGPAIGSTLAIQFNMEAIANGENSGKLKAGGGWLDNQGVAFLQLEGDLDSKQVMLELDSRFKDGKLSFVQQRTRLQSTMRSKVGGSTCTRMFSSLTLGSSRNRLWLSNQPRSGSSS